MADSASDLNINEEYSKINASSTKTFDKRMEPNQQDNVYPCDQCDYTFKFSSGLRQHIQTKHVGIRYPCDRCEYNATTPGHLKQHKESKHEGIRYPCDQCDYKATTSSTLKKHKQSIHEGLRYPCDQCDYVATTSSNLKKHKKSKHEGIRYPCDQCEYLATTSSSLYKHKKSKHEGMRCSCDQCDYAATTTSNLIKHTKRKHGDQLCDKTIVKTKGQHVKVMIEKLDLSKYLKHHISQNSVESEYIEISGMDVADTEIKIEDNIDPLSLDSSNCDLISKIEIEEDLVIKTESSDLSEFI